MYLKYKILSFFSTLREGRYYDILKIDNKNVSNVRKLLSNLDFCLKQKDANGQTKLFTLTVPSIFCQLENWSNGYLKIQIRFIVFCLHVLADTGDLLSRSVGQV